MVMHVLGAVQHQGTFLTFHLFILAYDVTFHANAEDIRLMLINFETFHLSTEAHAIYMFNLLSLLWNSLTYPK